MNLDATTQTGWVANTAPVGDPTTSVLTVELDGSALSAGTDGLVLTAGSDDSVVRGLSIVGVVGALADGLRIENSTNVVVVGNHIGVDATGLGVDGNYVGVVLDGSGHRLGDGTVAGRNVIAGNSFTGVYLDGTTSTDILGNDFGRLADGSTAGGNAAVIADNNAVAVIGGTAAGEGNRFTAADVGVMVGASTVSAEQVAIIGNIFVGLTNQAIDLATDGPTPNDAGDADTGPNGLLNVPVIDPPTVAGTVDFTLDAPAGDYRVELFVEPVSGPADPYLEYAGTITHTGSGAEPFSVPVSGLFDGDVLTATVTVDADGGPGVDPIATSEFSSPVVYAIDTDGDGLWDSQEDANLDADYDPATSPGPDTDGDTFANYNDPDDDGDGVGTASENADPNGDHDPRDALDVDRDGEPDYLDQATAATGAVVVEEQKVSDLSGGLTATLDDTDGFGSSTAAVGDLDGDGVVDLAVGAPLDDDGATDNGAVHILFMNTDGTVKAEQKISATAGRAHRPAVGSIGFGSAVAGIGDLDGDGIGDLAVGVAQDDDGGTSQGAVFVLFLNADGTVKGEQKISGTIGGLTGPLDASDEFGSSVAGIGDLDGDGLPDLVVGAPYDDDGGTDRGALYVLFLNADGTVRAEQKVSQSAGAGPTLDDSDFFGLAAALVGDVDGDGVGDLAVGAEGDDDGGTARGAVYILFMNTDGTVKGSQKISDSAGGLGAGLADVDSFGRATAGVGDLDGDGVPDLAVGAYGDNDGGSDRGAVYVLFLNADGTVRIEQKISDTAGGLTTSLDSGDSFGMSVAGTGDLDGDGTIGLAVGATGDDDGGANRGAVYVLDLSTFNNAPVLDNTGTMTLDPIDKTNFNSAGNTLAEIIASAGGDRITDADGDPEGIMITDATQSDNGWFEFSTDGGTTWTRYGSYWHGLLLRDTDRVRFVPTGFTAETGTLTIRAWDQTTGTAGTPLRDYGSGGTAAFSLATETVTITTNDVNQPPTFGTSGTSGVAGGANNLLTWDRHGEWDDFRSVAEAPDGSFFITGYDDGDTPGNDDVLLVKLTAAGAVDTTFGDDGHVIVPLGADDDRSVAVATQPDGKIVVAGQMLNADWDGFVARFDADGNLDNSFGGGDGWAAARPRRRRVLQRGRRAQRRDDHCGR